jgi:hypothetical protein
LAEAAGVWFFIGLGFLVSLVAFLLADDLGPFFPVCSRTMRLKDCVYNSPWQPTKGNVVSNGCFLNPGSDMAHGCYCVWCNLAEVRKSLKRCKHGVTEEHRLVAVSEQQWHRWHKDWEDKLFIEIHERSTMENIQQGAAVIVEGIEGRNVGIHAGAEE